MREATAAQPQAMASINALDKRFGTRRQHENIDAVQPGRYVVGRRLKVIILDADFRAQCVQSRFLRTAAYDDQLRARTGFSLAKARISVSTPFSGRSAHTVPITTCSLIAELPLRRWY